MEELKMTGKELIELMTMFREALDKGIDKTEAAIEKLSSKEAVHSVEETRAKDFVNEMKKRYPKITDNPPVKEPANTDDTVDPQIGFKCTSIDDIVKGISYYTGIHTDELADQVKEFIDSISTCKNEHCEECEREECKHYSVDELYAAGVRKKYYEFCEHFPIAKHITTMTADDILIVHKFFMQNNVTSKPIKSCGNEDTSRKTIFNITTPDTELCMCVDMNNLYYEKCLRNPGDLNGIRINLTINSKFELTSVIADHFPDMMLRYFNRISETMGYEHGCTLPFKLITDTSDINKCDTYWNYNASYLIDIQDGIASIKYNSLLGLMTIYSMIYEIIVRMFMMTKHELDIETTKHHQNANKSRMNEQLLSSFDELAGKFDVLKDIINMPKKSQAKIANLFKKYNVGDVGDLSESKYITYGLCGSTPYGTYVNMLTNCPNRSLWDQLSTTGHVEFTIDISIGRSNLITTKMLEACGNAVLKMRSINSLSMKADVDFTGSFNETGDGGVYGHINVKIGCKDRTSNSSIVNAIDACKQMIVLTFINTLTIITSRENIEKPLDQYKK